MWIFVEAGTVYYVKRWKGLGKGKIMGSLLIIY